MKMKATIKSSGQKLRIPPQYIEKHPEGIEIDTTGMLFSGEIVQPLVVRRAYFTILFLGIIAFLLWLISIYMTMIDFFHWAWTNHIVDMSYDIGRNIFQRR